MFGENNFGQDNTINKPEKISSGEFISEKNGILEETRELLDKEAIINEAKITIYEKLGINEKLELNSSFENFVKGFIDEVFFGSIEMAIEIINSGGKVIIDVIKQLATWEGIKTIANELKESVFNLFVGNSYEKGKSVAVVLPSILGVGFTFSAGKKGLSLGFKKILKLRINKEHLVESINVKGVIKQVNRSVEEIIPKKQLDFERMLVGDIAKINNSLDRIEAGKFFLNKKLTTIQEKAIIKAHEVGLLRKESGIGNYTFSEIRQKQKILSDAGFSKEETRILMEKGVCGKLSDGTGSIINTELMDTLDFFPDDLLKLSLNQVSKKIERFVDIIDINDLINNSERLSKLLDNVENICYYIQDNSKNILTLTGNELVDFKFNFSQLMKKVDTIFNDSRITPRLKLDINEIKNNNIAKAFYSLNPSLAPKIL